jgi:uncharacterized DUF497 family protein
MLFEWDEAKNAANRSKRGIDVADAACVFSGPLLRHSSPRSGEEGWIAAGAVGGRVLAVVYTIREGAIRLISARRARTNEIRAYRQNLAGGA